MYGIVELRGESAGKCEQACTGSALRLDFRSGVSNNKNPAYILEVISIFASLNRLFPTEFVRANKYTASANYVIDLLCDKPLIFHMCELIHLTDIITDRYPV
jgi:hypothetical protein